MRRHTAVTLGLALALSCAGAWAQDTNQAQTAPATAASTTGAAPTVIALGETYSPLQQFVSQQALEVALLSMQVERAKADHNPGLARTLTHMIRDHVLVENAAQDVLARRGEVSRPTTLLLQEEPPASTTDMVQRDLAMHQDALNNVQQLASNATDPGERSVYEHAIPAIKQHIDWLQQSSEGKQVDAGFFGPTPSIAVIAALPAPAQQVAGSRVSYAQPRRVSHRRHHRTHHRRVRRSSRRTY